MLRWSGMSHTMRRAFSCRTHICPAPNPERPTMLFRRLAFSRTLNTTLLSALLLGGASWSASAGPVLRATLKMIELRPMALVKLWSGTTSAMTAARAGC